MNILITGSKGMLATDLIALAKAQGHEVACHDVDTLDITQAKDFEKLKHFAPDLVINCAAYTNVDKAEDDKEKCYQINVLGVRNIAHYCRSVHAALIHISTDYVFGGDKSSYDEDDAWNPINYYGQTKADSEKEVRSILERHYIVRTSWLFGKHGKNFVQTILDLAQKNDSIDVVNDQIGRPTYTVDLATAMLDLPTKTYGTYHITNSDQCSWFMFASQIVKKAGIPCVVRPCTSDKFPRKAKRPRYSVLNNNKISPLRSWQHALDAYLAQTHGDVKQ